MNNFQGGRNRGGNGTKTARKWEGKWHEPPPPPKVMPPPPLPLTPLDLYWPLAVPALDF